MNGETNNSFARRTGLSEGLIRKYIKGLSYPALDNLVSLANALGVSIEWLAVGNASLHNALKYSDAALSPERNVQSNKWFDILDTVTEQDKDTALKNIINKGFKTLLVDIESDQHTSQPKSAKQTVIDLLSELDETEIKGILNILYPEVEDIKKTQKRA